ncbi:MAG TPA: hypothetical protein ENK43_07180 [Planctomycetes bacterium]|nr:hypothetical protein [Planctomycetota bacterium]
MEASPMGQHLDRYPNSPMLTSRDVRKSLDFYTKILGFSLDECWPDEAHPMWASLSKDRQCLMVGCPPQEEMCAAKELAEDRRAWWSDLKKAFESHPAGVGVALYFTVPDVDALHASIIEKGGSPATTPENQFYGLREFGVVDPDGYHLVFYTPIAMSTCQSCGMPLTDAKPGQMYCSYCTDDNGNLKPYEEILEGTIQGYFMGMQNMERPQAEVAAKEHLSKMPAWSARKD